MRAQLACLLVLLMIAPPATAAHDRSNVTPAPVVGEAFRDAIFDANDTITRIEERKGEPLIEARQQLDDGREAHNSGNHWMTMSKIFQAMTVAERAAIEHEIRGASDKDAAFKAETKDAWQQADAVIHDMHERMTDLEKAGVDLWELDHAILAGMLLTKGERVHAQYPMIEKQWDQGQRGDEMRNGLVAFSEGATTYVEVADRLLTKALQESPDEPVGPVVGSATLEATVDAIAPMVGNKSVSFDDEMRKIVNGNMQEEEWLASLGAIAAWSERQASAAVQHQLGEPEQAYEAEAIVHHLDHEVHNGTHLETFKDLGVDAANARYSLAQAIANLRAAEAQLENAENEQEEMRAALSAAEGLGALSVVNVNMAALEIVDGQHPTYDLVHLPVTTAGAAALEGDPPAEDQSAEDRSMPVSIWLGALTVAVLVGVAVATYRKR